MTEQETIERSRVVLRKWLDEQGGDTERLARWMRDCLRIGGLRACRALIADALHDES